MLKTLGWLAGGLVFGAVVVAWLLPSNEVDEASPIVAASSGNDRELAADVQVLSARVGDLEDEISRLTTALEELGGRVTETTNRANAVATTREEAIRRLEQLIVSATPDGPASGMPPGVPVADGWVFQNAGPNEMRMVMTGPDGAPVVVTPESTALANASGQPIPAPPNITGIEGQTGQALIFRVTGSTEGTVWGTDTYTDDSSIAAAAVHAGVLQPGETGVVMLTLQDGAPNYSGSSRFGIESENYGDWGRSYAIQRLY